MELGQKIKDLRQELGLSQRQLCCDVITRNMLSQIENGSARPSMDTLSYLAGKLRKPVSYFLEEDAVTSPNQAVMEQAREAYADGEYDRAAEILQGYKAPDETFDWEKGLLHSLLCLAQAEQAIKENRIPYAKHLLESAVPDSPYCKLLEDKRLLLWSAIDAGVPVPDVDAVLLQKAESALGRGNAARAGEYLAAAEDKNAARWKCLRGEVCFALGEYREATEYLCQVEDVYPEAVIPKLEQCFSKLEDYKMAYHYACKQKR